MTQQTELIIYLLIGFIAIAFILVGFIFAVVQYKTQKRELENYYSLKNYKNE